VTRYRQFDISEIEDLFRRVEALEARVASFDGGTSPVAAADAPIDPQIVELMRQGRTIEAIKIYRDQTGVGLAEAKAAVEQLAGPGLPS
jgi:ribosomal protein L7/L12